MAHPTYWKETVHNQHRRAIWHNYYDRAIYMVTLSKHKKCPAFGSLRYSTPTDAKIDLSSTGEILRYQIDITPKFHPELIILEEVIMPDHAHILIQVTKPIEKHFGDIIQAIKSATTSAIHKLTGDKEFPAFDDGFHDRIVTDHRQLDTLYRYIRQNPYRLAVRMANPEFFRRINSLKIGGKSYQAYGNFQLLDNPFKEQVVVHRTDTEDCRRQARERWLYTGANGGVLVSPFISQAEKAIRAEAEALGGRFILIVNKPMEERYKPSGHDFGLCECGRLLILSANLPGDLSRSTCLAMNALAVSVAAERISQAPLE